MFDFLLPIALGLPAFVPGIVLHELAHALAAEKLGDPTARMSGRISLNPKAHFDRLGALVYIITSVLSSMAGRPFAFGWAKPVPINPFNFRKPRRDMAISSIAGPLSNLLQLAVWAGLLHVLRADVAGSGSIWWAWEIVAQRNDLIGYTIVMGLILNGVLVGFNMVPIPPLDGSRILAWLLPERYAYALDQLERYGMLILFVAISFGFLGFILPFVEGLINLFL